MQGCHLGYEHQSVGVYHGAGVFPLSLQNPRHDSSLIQLTSACCCVLISGPTLTRLTAISIEGIYYFLSQLVAQNMSWQGQPSRRKY